MELVWKYGRLSSIPFLKSSIPFHSGIFHIPYRNFRSIPFSIPYHALSTDSYLLSLHFVVNIIKAMFKSICLSLIFTPCCRYTYSKNNVKFLKSTSSELRQELFKLNRVAAASTLCFTFETFLQCKLNFKSPQTRQPFSTIFHVKFFIQVLCSLNFLRLLHFVQLKFVIVLLVTVV